MLRTEDTVSTQTQAGWIFAMDDDSRNRRRCRSPEPKQAVTYQFERVVDVVASEAIVLCDQRGRPLSSVGSGQLCRMLSQSVPAIFTGDATREVQLKALEIVRPNLDWSHIAIRPIAIPFKRNKLFVASISESTFNQAGVHHAGDGVRRILGIPDRLVAQKPRVISSRDRLCYDVSRALEHGFTEFWASPEAFNLRVKQAHNTSRRAYVQALEMMLERVHHRLAREGLIVDRPSLWDRWFGRGESAQVGYRRRRFELPVRGLAPSRRVGTLSIEMTVYTRGFEIPEVPKAVLHLGC
jgi:hypothetical protein